MKSQELVRDYFDREAVRFDAIYEEHKPLWERCTDRLRQVVVERFHLIRVLAPMPGEWSLLDVGCGPGRYSLAMARAGATVVGVDTAAAMIEIARGESRRQNLEANCEFIVSPFSNFDSPRKFDVVIATGYFDYLEQPLPELAKMLGFCRGRLFASFPKRWEWRVPIRRVRFALQRGFVRFYSRPELDRLLADAGLTDEQVTVIDLGRDWIVVARKFS